MQSNKTLQHHPSSSQTPPIQLSPPPQLMLLHVHEQSRGYKQHGDILMLSAWSHKTNTFINKIKTYCWLLLQDCVTNFTGLFLIYNKRCGTKTTKMQKFFSVTERGLRCELNLVPLPHYDESCELIELLIGYFWILSGNLVTRWMV